jgi:hypothetical protein
MKKLIIFVFILIFIGAIPISCNIFCGGCGCGDSEVKNFTIKELGLSSVNPELIQIDTSMIYDFDIYLKNIHVAAKEFTLNYFHNQSLFTSSAFACSPVEPRADQKFQHIKITTQEDITLSGPSDFLSAGQEITDRFELTFGGGYFQEIQSFIDDGYFIEDRFYLVRLKVRPYQPTRLKLKFEITLTDSQSYLFANETLNVK